MDDLAAHQRAQEVFGEVLANVTSDQFDLPTPCEEWTVKGLIDHMVTGNQRVQSRAGREAVALPDGLLAAHAAAAAGAHAVFAAPDGLTRLFDLPIGTLPATEARDGHRCPGSLRRVAERRTEVEASMGTVLVVVADVALEDPAKVSLVQDEQAVGALGAHGAHPALCDRVRVRRPDGRAHDGRALTFPHRVEGRPELVVTIAQDMADPHPRLRETRRDVAGLLGRPLPGRLVVIPDTNTRREPWWMKNNTYSRRSETVSTVKKSQATMPAACWRKNWRQVLELCRGAGSMPSARSTLAIVLAATRYPRSTSSPRMRW